MKKTLFALTVLAASTFMYTASTPANAMSVNPFTTVTDSVKTDNAVTQVGWHHRHHHHWGHHHHWRPYWGWRRHHGWHCWWRYGERYCSWN